MICGGQVYDRNQSIWAVVLPTLFSWLSWPPVPLLLQPQDGLDCELWFLSPHLQDESSELFGVSPTTCLSVDGFVCVGDVGMNVISESR